MKFQYSALLIPALLSISGVSAAQQQQPSMQELWQLVQQQQSQIEALQAEISVMKQQTQATDDKVAATDAKVEATGDYVESLVVDSSVNKTHIGGYGELHYNNVSSAAGDSDAIDFHRFVLFFGHEFTDRIRFFSEFELEHSLAGDGAPGEVELEQAYAEFLLTENTAARAGLFLVPIGILNETHEPPTFYGVERNDVENIILPSTWWEAGAAFTGRTNGGFSWDVALHSGLAMPTSGGSAYRVRSGRQKVAEAIASDPAYTLRAKYTGIPGLELAASYQYQSDPSQVAGDGLDSGQLFTTHAVYQHGGFGLRALFAQWRFEGAGVEAAAADRQDGWYIEPSYRINEKWGTYVRYQDLDGARDQDQFTQNEFGFNFWPTEGVVLKMNFRDRNYSLPGLAGSDFEAIDLGFGYNF